MTVAETIAGWARELSDVGGANTLLWAPTRRDCLLDLTTAHPGGVSMLLAGRQTRLSDLVREAGAFDEALVVARRIHDQTEDLLATRGLACGFVVIGVATWDPPRAGAVVEAPVLLRSCTLRSTAHASTGDTRADSQGQSSQTAQASQPDYVLDLGDNVEVNPALVNYLRSVAGIDVDPIALVGLAEGAFGFDPYPVYAALGRLCADVPGFSVTPRIVLGTYPYAKLDMVADVSANARWLAQVDLVAALAGDQHARDRLPAATPPVVDEPDIDREVAPIDLDPAQQSIVDAVRAGGSVVLDAPRGTGGTQTVAALVASAAYEGKSVLYVTTRSQSVRDLTARLREAELPDLVLDLLGADALGSSAVAAVVAGLDDLTAHDRPDPDARTRADRAAALTVARRALIDHVEALHERRMPWGVTAYEVQEAMARLATQTPPPGSRVRISGPTLRELSPMRIAELSAALQSAAAAGAWDTGSGHVPRGDDDTGPDHSDPWYGADISSDADLERAQQILERLAGDGFATRAKDLDAILAESSLPPARTPADWERALRTMRGVRDTLEVFRPEIFDGPLDEHVAATGTRDFRERADEVAMGWLTRLRVRRQTRRLLRPGKPPADLHAELISAREQRTYWFDLVGAGGRPEISPRLDEAQAAYDSLASDLHWLGDRLAGTEAGGGLHDLTMPLVRGRLNHLAARSERLTILPKVTPVLTELTAAGMAEVLDDFARRNVAAAQVPTELEHIWWGSIGQEITLADPRYAGHDGPTLRRHASTFRELDVARRSESRALVRAQHQRVARRRIREHARQVDLLRSQVGAGRGRLRFADLFREAESVLTAVRPCVAMSPYAVAQLLTPGTAFDLVIVDDASGVTVAESVSALSRARQVVVVGHRSEGAPSRFRVGVPRSSGSSESDGSDGSDGSLRHPRPSSLLAAATDALPTRSLRWWHTTADPRLRADGIPQLLGGVSSPTIASPVTFEWVDGLASFAPTGNAPVEWTAAEADRVREVVLARRAAGQTVAVVALTTVMADLVREELARRGASDVPVATPSDGAVAADVVVVAVSYGRTPRGRVVYHFPSLTDDAVPAIETALAGAQQELHVVSALRAEDLAPERLRTAGTQWLLAFLARAEGATPEATEESTAATGTASAVLDYLWERLLAEGLVAAPLWGVGPHRIDLAVGHPDVPERYLVAVTSDGPGYAALPGTRFRERLRPEQLARSGWSWVPVWSTDVYRDPAREVARIVAEVRAHLREVATTAVTHHATETGKAAAAETAAHEHAELAVEEQVSADQVAEEADVDGDAMSDEHSTPEPPKPRVKPTVDQTRDDTDAGWGERADESAHDRWLEEQRPPHWK